MTVTVTPTVTATPTVTVTPTVGISTSSPSATHSDDEAHGEEPHQENWGNVAPPEPTAADRAAAVTAATATMKVYIQGQALEQGAWQKALQPTLDPGIGLDSYGTMYGYRAEATRITGAITLTYLEWQFATAAVPTDHGVYTVTVTRQGTWESPGPYLTSNIALPRVKEANTGE